MNWLAKVVSMVLIELAPKLASWLGKKIKDGFVWSKKKIERKKQIKEIKNATTKDELDDSFDNLN